jgi:hypothetical protein
MKVPPPSSSYKRCFLQKVYSQQGGGGKESYVSACEQKR